MASGANLATAYVTITASTRGVGKQIVSDFSTAGNLGGQKAGDGLIAGLGRGLKIATGLTAAFFAGVAALSIKGGISRQLNIEDAQAKLRGLGHSTDAVKTIMNDALAAVRGTAFGLDAAATTAATAVAAGVQPGQQLERYLRLTADAAVIAGVSIDEMGDIMNKVQTKGHASMREINMFQQRGIPIMIMLAESYGVTADEMSNMVSRGEVDAARFQQVLEDKVGGAALSAGDTTRGSFRNMTTAFSRLGVSLTSWFFPLIKDVFKSITAVVDNVTDAVGAFFAKFSDGFQKTAGEAIAGFPAKFENSMLRVNAAFALVKTGEFSADIEKTFGAPADSGLAAFLMQINKLAVSVKNTVVEAFSAMAAAYTSGATEISQGGFAGFLESLAIGARAFVDAFGGTLGELGGQVLEILRAFSPLAYIFEAMNPILPQFASALGEIGTALGGALATILPVIAQLFEQIAVVLSGAILAAMPMIVMLVTVLAEVFAALIPPVAELITQLIGGLEPILPALASALGQVAGALGGALIAAVNAILPILIQLVEGALAVMLPMLPTIANLIGLLASVFVSLINSVLPILPALGLLGEQLLRALLPFLPTLIDLMLVVVEAFMLLLDALLPLFPALMSLIAIVIDIVAVALPPLIAIFYRISDIIATVFIAAFKSIVPVIAGIIKVFTGIIEFLAGVFAAAFHGIAQVITTIWNVIFTATGAVWTAIKTAIMTPVDWIKTAVTAAFNFVADGIKNAMNGMRDGIAAAFNGFVGIIKAPLNAVIALVNSAIGALNSISIEIPDWIPGLGGQKFGVNIPKIPRLALGADIMPRDGGTLALLAEKGKAETVTDYGSTNALIANANLLAKQALEGAKNQPLNVTQNIEVAETDPALLARILAREVRLAG